MSSPSPLLIFGAHPDDIEFGAGGIVAVESARGRKVHFVVCSQGESGTSGTPQERRKEAEAGAACLGATLEFVDLGGDAHFEERVDHAIKLASLIRRHRPSTLLGPVPDANQHPDHVVLARLVATAARLARYGGVTELREMPPHAVSAVLRYAITSENYRPPTILIDVSTEWMRWKEAMEAHSSQARTRDYLTLQLTRARWHGLQAGVEYALPLWSDDPIVHSSLEALDASARRF